MDTGGVFEAYRGLDDWSVDIVRGVRAVIAGCGALGAALAEMLAAMGAGAIVLVDDDKVEERNVLRTATLTTGDLGRYKVDAVAAGLRRRFSETTRVVPLRGSVETTLGIGLARRAACVFLCTDNRASRQYTCRIARAAGTVHVNGAIEGFCGLVGGVFAPPASACYECNLTRRERQELMPTRFSCTPRPDERAPSVPTTPIAASITAAFMAHLALRYLHGDAQAIARRIFINPPLNDIQTARYERRGDCTCAGDGPPVEPISLEAASDEMTARDLLREARATCGGDASIALDYSLVTEEVCAQCGQRVALELPRHEAAVSSCPACRSPMTGVAWTGVIDKGHPLVDCTFRDLQLPPLHAITVWGSGGSAVFELELDARRIGLED